jgi:Cap4 dsDNA endonuclease
LTFASRLISEPQREKSGETGAQRYDYQALWGLSLIFRHHDASTDYAISFEFHDDIILLDSASAPSKAAFYQVKTKAKGHWTLTELTSRKTKKNDPSNGLLPSHLVAHCL